MVGRVTPNSAAICATGPGHRYARSSSSMSADRSARASESRSPLRYSRVSRARLRMPAGARGEHAPISAVTLPGVSGSAG
jgi:hypothetical protein